MTSLGFTARAMLLGAALAAAAAMSEPAAAQSEALPPDVARAIEQAISLSEVAAANAAFSADIANDGRPTGIAERTRLHVARSNLAEAVVEGIARHPRAAAAIVSAAVRRAPDHAPAIVNRAIIAFPSFSTIITAAAGMPPPPQSPLPPYLSPPPVYASPAPAVRVVQAVVLPRPTARAVPARASSRPAFGISELRFGVVNHDTGVFGRNEEDGIDIALAVRFVPLSGDLWDAIGNPRPFIGANINTAGDTSAINFGANWDWDVWRRTFFSFSFGGAAHTGKTKTLRLDRKELGSRVLFYLAAELGYRIDQRNSLAVRLDHMSNAGIVDKNEGLDTIGLIYGYHF